MAVAAATVGQLIKIAEALAWFDHLVSRLISKLCIWLCVWLCIWLCISSSALHILRPCLHPCLRTCFNCWPKTVYLIGDDVLQLIVRSFD